MPPSSIVFFGMVIFVGFSICVLFEQRTTVARTRIPLFSFFTRWLSQVHTSIPTTRVAKGSCLAFTKILPEESAQITFATQSPLPASKFPIP